MNMDDVADASETYAASIFKAEVCKFPCKCIYICDHILRNVGG